ncbi:MAG: NBR1-Ig-like domain-containing protein, partial [Anaerolineales bacterium]
MFRQKFISILLLTGMLITQAVPRALAATYCDSAQFVSDLTIPDGSSFSPGATFIKTWRLMNSGTCTWTESYHIRFDSGHAMGSSIPVKLPVSVAPGQTVDISVSLTAPLTGGHYKGYWKLTNASATPFGMGDSASDPFWVDINVIEINAVIYDFVTNAPYAQWKSGAGLLPFPGTSGDSRGFSYQVNNPHLEDDSFDSSPGLLTVPQNKFNGYIQATYPEFQIQQGDLLQTLVNCEFGATSCYVTFRVDYLTPSGVQKTLWSWKETHDKRFYRANIDLSPLAGQKVRFVFMLLSTGFASGDRAIWGSPRIVRTGTVQPPAPPATLTPLPPLPATATPLGQPPPTIQPAGCDKASFVTDVTVPDGTVFAPGAAFTKTWRLKNAGSCAWTTSYKLVYYSGEQMGAPTSVNLPWNVALGQTVDISVNMVAPSTAGEYRGFWILSNANGQFFGIGTDASKPIWVEIKVAGDAPYEGGYNFWLNACSAQWKSGAGALPCPGAVGDRKGFIIADGFSHLEDGTMGPLPTLLMAPENKYNGYIQGFYPAFTVQPGDHFVTATGCEYGASCYATFRLDYMTPNGGIFNFWTWREQNDKKNHMASVDLTPLAGRSVRFILTTLATGSASGDLVRWGGPTIVRVGGSTSPTITPIPPTNGWPTYTNSTYGFQFKYPPQSERFFETTNSVLISMPITPGTNLREKYLQTTVIENANPCQSPLATSSMLASSETVVINGISFLKQTGGDGGAGNFHEWIAYSTIKNNACISMDFVLHSLNAGSFETPIPEFDKAAESAVFLQMMSTFVWLTTLPTPTFTSVPPTLTPIPPPTLTPSAGTVVSSPSIRQLFMIDASNGWAIGDSYLLRTTNGGATWYNMLPEDTPIGGFFASSAKGWVLSSFSDISVGTLYRTTNGGLNWTKYDVPFNSGQIQFLDDNNGFVLNGELSGMQKHPVSLYQTSDGGATWTLKYTNIPTAPNPGTSLPFSGHKNGMTFRDTSNGWVGGDYPNNGYVYLYRTSDGGVNWSRIQLTLPAGYESAFITTTAPKFFGINDAILPVWMTLGAGMRDLFLYISHDGGATWTPSASFARNAEHTDIVSTNDVISWDWANVFHVSSNAGSGWTTVTPNVNFGDSFRGMDFVSPATGWATRESVNGVTPLYRTSDGGATWTLISGNPPAPPGSTPTPDPAAFAQTVVDTLNARNFDAVKASMDQSFAFAFWQSQGFPSTPDSAIEQLRTNYLGATPLAPNPGKDLNVLLGGLNPYTIMGLDPATSQG